MRLWHYKLIPYLPKTQLLALWRELNSIFAHQPNHILINYVYNYPKDYLYTYANLVLNEMSKRNIRIVSKANFFDYFGKEGYTTQYFNEHNKEYLTICYYNLKEKFICGQKDFSKEIWKELQKFYIDN